MQPFFFEGVSGKLFCLFFPAQGNQEKGAVLHVPAFAEEMNKSRHVVVKQARKLAQSGYSVLLVDLFGTGDSEGEFVEARWHIWQQDIDLLIGWLRETKHQNITLWGLRLGALLAFSCAQSNQAIQQLLLWQPVISGEQFAQQFLRLRLAASMMSGGEKETVKSLKARLDNGDSLEVAGYELAPQLFTSVAESNMKSVVLVDHLQAVKWLEVSGSKKELAIPSQKLLADWRETLNVPINAEAVEGKQFWSNQEIVWADSLITKTSEMFSG